MVLISQFTLFFLVFAAIGAIVLLIMGLVIWKRKKEESDEDSSDE